MDTMKAVQIESFGGPEMLRIQDVDRPQPKDDEVLIQVRAASVNPVDYKIRAGRYPPVKEESLPKVLGRDISGVIVGRGAAVATFLDGDEVIAMLDRGQGGYAEYVALAADLCVHKAGKPRPRRSRCRSARRDDRLARAVRSWRGRRSGSACSFTAAPAAWDILRYSSPRPRAPTSSPPARPTTRSSCSRSARTRPSTTTRSASKIGSPKSISYSI